MSCPLHEATSSAGLPATTVRLLSCVFENAPAVDVANNDGERASRPVILLVLEEAVVAVLFNKKDYSHIHNKIGYSANGKPIRHVKAEKEQRAAR